MSEFSRFKVPIHNYEVTKFVELMRLKLEKNRHKPGWKKDDPLALFKRLLEEATELYDAVVLRGNDYHAAEAIGLEAADVANFAMMIADVCGALGQPTTFWPNDSPLNQETENHWVDAFKYAWGIDLGREEYVKPEIVRIDRIQVHSDDPDRFVFGLKQMAEETVIILSFVRRWPRMVALDLPQRPIHADTAAVRCVNCKEWTRHTTRVAVDEDGSVKKYWIAWCATCKAKHCETCGRRAINGQIPMTCKTCKQTFCYSHFDGPCKACDGAHCLPAGHFRVGR